MKGGNLRRKGVETHPGRSKRKNNGRRGESRSRVGDNENRKRHKDQCIGGITQGKGKDLKRGGGKSFYPRPPLTLQK